MSERFELVKRGYDPTAVDRYIVSLEQQINQYRSNDQAITNAILSAQKAGDDIVRNAKIQGAQMKKRTSDQLQDIFESINTQRAHLASFAAEYGTIVSKYLKVVDNDDFKAINAKIDNLESYLSDFTSEIEEDLEISKVMPDENEV